MTPPESALAEPPATGHAAALVAARAHIAALEQLLEVHEQTALEQSEHMERLLQREQAARAALAESDHRLRLALDAGGMGSWEWDIQHQRVIWSPEQERLLGMAEGTFEGTMDAYARCVHPEDRPYAVQLVYDALARRAPTHHVMHRIIRVDGTVRWLDSHGRFVYAEDGTPLRLVGVSTDVTERKEVEAARDRALAEASAERQRLYDVFMQAPAAIGVLEGPEHRFRVANPLYLQLVGGRQVLGLSVREALPEVAEQGFLELLDGVYASGEPFSAHEMLVRLDRDGDGVPEDLYVDFVYQPLKRLDGATFGIMVHAVETTQQVVSRQHVESLAAERSAILGQIVEVVITTDRTGAITFANGAAHALYGTLQLGVPIWDERQTFQLLHRNGQARAREETPLYRAMHGERVLNDEWRVRRADGTEVIVVGSAVPIIDRSGEQLGAALTVHDVSESRRLQRELEHERGRLREMLIQAPAAILVSEGPEHVFVMQNDFARQILGGRDVVGKRFCEAFPEAELQGLFAIYEQVYRSGEAFVGREVYSQVDRGGQGNNEGYFNFVYQPLFDTEQRVYGVLTFAVEVSDQVRARRLIEEKAEELAALSRDLERSNRDLDQFAYVASHDLKAPLRGIANLTQWIEEDIADALTTESREHMQLLKGRVNRMEGLIEGILEYSRAGRRREKRESLDVGQLLHDVIELASPPAGVHIEVDRSMPVMQTERVPLQQVFLNLIGNAIKHGGRPDLCIRITAQPVPDGYQFTVADNGPGIPGQFHDRVWQIFQTLAARDKIEGTGIGLSVVRKIVEARGGRTWLESAEGEGAAFHFIWPDGPRTTE